MRVKFETCHPEIENPACLRPGLMGQGTEGSSFDVGNIVVGTLRFLQHTKKPHQIGPFGNCLPGFQRVPNKTVYACLGCKQAKLSATTLARKSERINSGKWCHAVGRTRRSLKTRADNDCRQRQAGF